MAKGFADRTQRLLQYSCGLSVARHQYDNGFLYFYDSALTVVPSGLLESDLLQLYLHLRRME